MNNIKQTQSNKLDYFELAVLDFENDITEQAEKLLKTSSIHSYEEVADKLEAKLSDFYEFVSENHSSFIKGPVFYKITNTLIEAYEIAINKGDEILGQIESTSNKLNDRILDKRRDASKMLDHLGNVLQDNDQNLAGMLIEFMPNKVFEDQWKFYFDEIGIDYQYCKEVEIDNGMKDVFTFYLPTFKCFAEVISGPLQNYIYDKIRETVIGTKTPVLLLTEEPNYRFYEIMYPDEEGGIDVNIVNLVPNAEKEGGFIKGNLSCKSQFKSNGYEEVISAIEKTKATFNF